VGITVSTRVVVTGPAVGGGGVPDGLVGFGLSSHDVARTTSPAAATRTARRQYVDIAELLEVVTRTQCAPHLLMKS
jgi:hypothetical protein